SQSLHRCADGIALRRYGDAGFPSEPKAPLRCTYQLCSQHLRRGQLQRTNRVRGGSQGEALAALVALVEVDMGKTLPAAQGHTDEFGIKVGGALAPVLRSLVRSSVRAELQAAGEADPWIPHPRWPCVSRRAACALARSGDLQGVRRVGQGRGALYLVRRSVLDAWIEAHPVDTSGEAELDDYEREMSKRNLRPMRSRDETR